MIFGIMPRRIDNSKTVSAEQAQRNAHLIASGAIVFQVARVMVRTGIFACISSEGRTMEEIAASTGLPLYGVKVLLDRESLPSVEEICADASSKEERMQILDVVTRMAACDGDVPDIEQNFILRVAHLLGIGNQNDQAVVDYALGLSVSYKQMASINAMFGMTDLDILAKMRIEYTEGAAYYHLAEMYKNGSELYGGIRKDENKALEYFNKAKERGFGHGEFRRLY